jgi:hypothetical protein
MYSSRKQTEDIKSRIMKELDDSPDVFIIWKPWEDELLKKYYPSKGCGTLSKVLKKGYSNVRNRAHQLGIYVNRGKFLKENT